MAALMIIQTADICAAYAPWRLPGTHGKVQRGQFEHLYLSFGRYLGRSMFQFLLRIALMLSVYIMGTHFFGAFFFTFGEFFLDFVLPTILLLLLFLLFLLF